MYHTIATIFSSVRVEVNTTNGSEATCSGFYNQTVKLNCSLSEGMWFKDGCTHSVCLSSVCSLTDLSFSASSGLYFCKAAELTVYLRLTVKGKETITEYC